MVKAMGRQKQQSQRCPICGQEKKKKVFCEECGWDFTAALEDNTLQMLSAKERSEYDRRIALLKKIYEAYKKSRETEKKQKNIEKIEKIESQKNTVTFRPKNSDGRKVLTDRETSSLGKATICATVTAGYKAIGEHAFEKSSLTEIFLPEIEKIGKMAFYFCENLEQVHAAQIREIGVEAFMGCKKLRKIDLTGVETIATSAFAYCESLEEITLPSTLKHIEYNAFRRCTALKKIYLEPGMSEKTIQQLYHITIQAKVIQRSPEKTSQQEKLLEEKVAEEKTQQEKALEEFTTKQLAMDSVFVEIPEGFYKIQAAGFEHCRKLKKVWMPDSITEIGAYAFCGCRQLEQIRWSMGLKKIGFSAFKDCAALKKIRVPEGVEEIGAAAFCGCENLEWVELPASLKKIGMDVFQGCSSLNVIWVANEIDQKLRKFLENQYRSIQVMSEEETRL